MVNPPTVTILAGIPGSGKSTYAATLPGVTISTDALRVWLCGGINDMSHNKAVFRLRDHLAVLLLSMGYSIILDSTNVRFGPLQELIAFIRRGLGDIPITLMLFDCDPAAAQQRIADDLADGKPRSNVPGELVDEMYQHYLDLVSRVDALGVAVQVVRPEDTSE